MRSDAGHVPRNQRESGQADGSAFEFRSFVSPPNLACATKISKKRMAIVVNYLTTAR